MSRPPPWHSTRTGHPRWVWFGYGESGGGRCPRIASVHRSRISASQCCRSLALHGQPVHSTSSEPAGSGFGASSSFGLALSSDHLPRSLTLPAQPSASQPCQPSLSHSLLFSTSSLPVRGCLCPPPLPPGAVACLIQSIPSLFFCPPVSDSPVLRDSDARSTHHSDVFFLRA